MLDKMPVSAGARLDASLVSADASDALTTSEEEAPTEDSSEETMAGDTEIPANQ